MSAAAGFNEPLPLSSLSAISLDGFDCGVETLNDWLIRRSRANEQLGARRTYVLTTGELKIAGCYCLSNHALQHAETNAALRRNMSNPIPTILLGRLAIDKRFQGCGLGGALLKHAIGKSSLVAQAVGCRGLVTEPINENARRFYLCHGFEEIRYGAALLIFKF